jgi:hypothetical protein
VNLQMLALVLAVLQQFLVHNDILRQVVANLHSNNKYQI